MAQSNASAESEKPSVGDNGPAHLRLVGYVNSQAHKPDVGSKDRGKPEAADELDDAWDNVPV